MRGFQENIAKLEAADTQVLGVSMDSPFANFAFGQQNGVTFPLLGDMSGETTRAYGLLNTMNIKGVKVDSARRATFLINKQGKVEEVHVDSQALDPNNIVTVCERKKKAS
ncbi:MAG TPA: redoxin domain-containing protein [Terriglobales bacterium]|nr:redoxin domain-containing protein [Terriglobales bacterium]